MPAWASAPSSLTLDIVCESENITTSISMVIQDASGETSGTFVGKFGFNRDVNTLH